MGIKVTLRAKKISKGRKSLYLDFYPPITHPETRELTRRKFLKMYVFENPTNHTDKIHNTDTWNLARLIRQKQENRLNKPEIYSDFEQEQIKKKEIGQKSFFEFFDKIIRKKANSSDKTHNSWKNTKNFLEKFHQKKDLTFNEITLQFCEEYKYFLETTTGLKNHKKLSPNTAHGYFVKFKAVLNQAFKDDLLSTDFSKKLSNITKVETKKEFLTLDELNLLAETECEDPQLKKIALFSSLTGLRISDIIKLTWDEVEEITENEYCIRFQQQKTKSIETLPISKQALELMGIPSQKTTQVFHKFTYSSHKNILLAKWIKKAGINKKITFHCFRHTYATLQLTYGTDIYTVSKMLGHKNISTTQVYAKIVDEKKREATNKIKINFPSNKKP